MREYAMRQKYVYWERSSDTEYPARLSLWVWDDGTVESYRYKFDYSKMARIFSSWRNRFPTQSPEERAEFVNYKQWDAMRYYRTRP